MPFKIMDHADKFSGDFRYPIERQVGFWKSNSISEEIGSDSVENFISSSPLKNPSLSGAHFQNNNGENHRNNFVNDRDLSTIGEGITNMMKTMHKSSDHLSNSWKMQHANHFPNNFGNNGSQWESSLFSSSFSDILNRNARLSANGVIPQNSVKVTSDLCEEDDPFEASEDIEAKTIGNLLPTEDDLLSGVSCDFDLNVRPTGGDDLEDFDLFSSGGGMELEGDENVVRALRHGGLSFRHRDSTGRIISENLIRQDQSCVSELKQTDTLFREPNFGILPSRQIGLENGTLHGLNPPIQAPVGPFIDHHPISRQGNLHPHSLPEYHDNLANGFHFNSPNPMVSNLRGGIGNTSVRGIGPTARILDMTKVSGSPVNGSSSPGHHLLWNKHISNQMMWPNSPSFPRNVTPHHVSHSTGFLRPPVLLPTTPVHHVGSAPAVDPWRNTYTGDLSDTFTGSLSNPGFPLRSPSHQLDASSNIFPRNGGVGSPHRMSNNFSGRNLMISVPASFDSSNDRGRNFPQRRVDSNSNPCDRKQYELDIDRIMKGEDTRTTLMIKNIPNKYTSKMLLAAIDEHCRGTYDFIYLPIDFKNKCNVGYAFINMIDSHQIIPFHNAFNGKKWEKFNSEKVTNLAYARIQGKAALVAHFQNSSLMNEDKRCRPILFRTDGPNAGDPEPFPVGPNVRLKLSKSRSGGNEENHQPGNHSNGVTVEDSGNGTDSSSD